ncbi:MAG: C45 family autoproteolytic acyltransferase/hydrolase, partial [Candidatus Acidiferrales bacterium]
EQLMKQYKGRIDVDLSKQFISDHYDSYEKKEQAGSRTLCGHGELSASGVKVWGWGPYYPGGAITGKVADSRMTEQMRFAARRGHPCGGDFLAASFLKAHPQYAWQAPLLRDMLAGPWTDFKTSDKA